MRVLLVAPPWLDIYADFKDAARIGCVSPPLGLMYLGGAVLRAGGECRIVDMEAHQVNVDDLLTIVREYSPDIIGLTATTPVYQNTKALGRVIRERFPDITLGIGGVHATIVGREIMDECPQFDFQVRGEGEQTIIEIMEALDAGRSLAGIGGVIYRENGQVIENPPRQLTHNLDGLPMPARHLLDPDLYKHYLPGKGYIKYAGIFTSRGCPFECTFCSQHTMYGRKVRWHSLDRVIDELRMVTGEMGVRHVIIMDETLTLKRKRVLAFCEAIKEAGLEFTWEGWTVASTIDEELLRAMKEAGLIRLSFGIESGDPEILKRIKKGITLEQVRNAYKVAAKVGIETRGSAILGHPYETRETAWRTIKFIHSIRECQQIFLNIATPYPGTELYQCAVSGEGGMRLLTTDYSRYTRYGDPVIEVNDLSAKDLRRLQRLGLLYFYLTPRRIWYNVVRRTGIRGGLVNAFAFVKGILGRSKQPRPASQAVGSQPSADLPM
jgi:radical SAM superfamily enzyme YgiQ (UPF0313 family)